MVMDNKINIFKKSDGGYIFLSHSHLDIKQVRKIRNILEDSGYEPLCFYLKCLTDDDEVEGLIKREIDSRDIFLYVESKNSKKSKWVQKEREYINSLKDKSVYKISIDKIDDLEAAVKGVLRRTRVFLEYSMVDRNLYNKIKQKLIEKDLKVIDPLEENYNHTFWKFAFKKWIRLVCKEGCYVPIVTKNSLKSIYFKYLLEYAFKTNPNVVVPIIVGDLDMNEVRSLIHHDVIYEKISEEATEEEINEVYKTVKYVLTNKQ